LERLNKTLREERSKETVTYHPKTKGRKRKSGERKKKS